MLNFLFSLYAWCISCLCINVCLSAICVGTVLCVKLYVCTCNLFLPRYSCTCVRACAGVCVCVCVCVCTYVCINAFFLSRSVFHFMLIIYCAVTINCPPSLLNCKRRWYITRLFAARCTSPWTVTCESSRISLNFID